MLRIRLILSGRGYHQHAELPEFLELPEEATLDDALAALAPLLPEQGQLSQSALVAVSGKHLGTVAAHASPRLANGDELVVLAPVAGG